MLMRPPDSAGLFAKEIPHEWGDFVPCDRDFAVCETACKYRPRRPEESFLYSKELPRRKKRTSKERD